MCVRACVSARARVVGHREPSARLERRGRATERERKENRGREWEGKREGESMYVRVFMYENTFYSKRTHSVNVFMYGYVCTKSMHV